MDGITIQKPNYEHPYHDPDGAILNEKNDVLEMRDQMDKSDWEYGRVSLQIVFEPMASLERDLSSRVDKPGKTIPHLQHANRCDTFGSVAPAGIQESNNSGNADLASTAATLQAKVKARKHSHDVQ